MFSGWSWKRIGFLVGGVLLAGVSTVIPAISVFGVPLSQVLLTAGGFGAGVATLTPGHGPLDK